MQKVPLAPTIYDNKNEFTDFLALTSDAFISENGSSHQSVFVTPKPLFSDGEARGEDQVEFPDSFFFDMPNLDHLHNQVVG